MNDRMLDLPAPDLRALVSGEVIVAFVAAGVVTAGDVVTLGSSGPRPAAELKPAYRRWADTAAPDGRWSATVEHVVAADRLEPDAGKSRHILENVGEGDLIVLRVIGRSGPVLSDDAFAARRASLDAAMSP
ncbi:MAG: hypothetical protein QNJ88_08115 [Acidimicrobiia bacterium]|nr:hypothetical protein [Acidimicrobiia bacterium]